MKRLRTLWQDASGTTLTEVLVYVALLTGFAATMGTALYQSIRTQPVIVDDGLAVNELRKGLGWVAGDVRMARYATVTGDMLELAWTNYFGGTTTTDYAVTYTYDPLGGELLRAHQVATAPADTLVAARRVAGVAFSSDTDDRSITAELTVEARGGDTSKLSVTAIMKTEPPPSP